MNSSRIRSLYTTDGVAFRILKSIIENKRAVARRVIFHYPPADWAESGQEEFFK